MITAYVSSIRRVVTHINNVLSGITSFTFYELGNMKQRMRLLITFLLVFEMVMPTLAVPPYPGYGFDRIEIFLMKRDFLIRI